jgi:hypothetical protein
MRGAFALFLNCPNSHRCRAADSDRIRFGRSRLNGKA